MFEVKLELQKSVHVRNMIENPRKYSMKGLI